MKIENKIDLKDVKRYMEEHANQSIKKIQEKKSNTLDVIGLTMKDIRDLGKKIGVNQELADELFESNIFEYLMLGSIISDPNSLDEVKIRNWIQKAKSTSVVDQGLSSLLIMYKDRHHLIDSLLTDDDEDIRYGGYSLLSSYYRQEPLETFQIDLGIKALEAIKKNLLKEPITIQNAMNNAVVMAGLHVPDLVDLAVEVAKHIGYVMPLVAKNQCNIQSASDYLKRYIDQPKFSRVARLRAGKV